MSLLDFFERLQYSPLLVAMRSSSWAFPVIASLHLMGLALLGGAVLIVDLRLLGFGLRNQPLAQIARDAERWLLVSLAVLLPTGILQFMCFAATKYYYLTAFWVKMATLPLALDAALATGSIKRSDLVVFAAVGAGFTAGATLVRWQ